MALGDALQEELTNSRTRLCHLGRLIQQMSTDDQHSLSVALDQVRESRRVSTQNNGYSKLTAAAIRRALVAEGYEVSKDTVEKHVAQTCGCEQS